MKKKTPLSYLSISLLMAVIMAILPAADAGVVVSSNSQPFTLLSPGLTNNLLSVATSSSRATAPAKPNVVAECVVAVVVIVVGTIVIVKLIHLCHKVLPPATNAPAAYSPPSNSSSNPHSPFPAVVRANDLTSSDTNVYAAWFTVGPDNANDLASSVAIVIPSGVTATTNGAIPWLQTPTAPSPSTFVSLADYMSQIQTVYGLAPGSYYALPGTTAFSVNGQPTSSIPNIVWDFSGGTGLTVTNGNAPSYIAIYERINDLTTTNWIPFFTNTVSAGQTINVEDDDAPAQAGFYRVVLQSQ